MDIEINQVNQWKPIQDGLAQTAGLSFLSYGPSTSVDLDHPLCPPSNDNPICRLLQERYGRKAECAADCGRQVAEAFATGRGTSFQCHANLRAFTVPVTDDRGVSMVVLGGKSFASYEDFFSFREVAKKYGVDQDALLALVQDIQFKDRPLFDAASKLVGLIGQSLVRGIAAKGRREAGTARLSTLFSIAAELGRQRDTASVFRLILNTVGVLFNANTALILGSNGPGESYRVVDGFGVQREALQTLTGNRRSGLLARVAATGDFVSAAMPSELGAAGFPAGVGSVSLCSIASEARYVLAIVDTPLSPDDIRLVETFCAFCTVVLDKLILRETVTDRRQELSTLTELIRHSASTLAVSDLFQMVLDRTTASVEAEQGSLLYLDQDRNELVIKAIKGLNPKLVESVRIRPGEGISGMVFAEGTSLLVSDLETDVRVLQEKRPRYRTRSFVSLPIRAEDRTVGVLNVADKVTGAPFTADDLELLTLIASYTTIAVQRSEFYRRSEELKRISITDSFTGLLNKGYFQERLAEEIERFKRHKLSFSLIMIDIDDFKRLNDTHGHIVGDEALVTTARSIRNSIRAIDVAARYGGEEFTVILPQTSKQSARTMAQRIGRAVARTPIHTPSGDLLYLTVSLGVASFPEDAGTLDDLLQRADLAMYEAKRRGKNQAVVYTAPAPQQR